MGSSFSVLWRAVRNLESRRFLWAFFHAPGTLRPNRIDREQVRPGTEGWAEGSGGGEEGGACLRRFEFG